MPSKCTLAVGGDVKEDQADKSYSNPEYSSKQRSAEFESLIHQVCPIFK